MKNQVPNNSNHPGGNSMFWHDDMVRNYDYLQSLLSEKKEEVLSDIVRIIAYFCKKNGLQTPGILDIGCGPGTPATLSACTLKSLPNSNVVGVDSSNQMVEAARHNLHEYGGRFTARVGDFNSSDFWNDRLNRTFDFVVSSGSLHYLSDVRRMTFLKETHGHLEDQGVLIAGVATCSDIPSIAEMEQLFRIEYTYGKLPEDKKPREFDVFRKSFTEVDRKANINWKSQSVWLEALRSAGFQRSDLTWHLWVRSIFVALK